MRPPIQAPRATSTTIATPTPANWAGDATNESLLIPKAVVATIPARKTAMYALKPIFPSQGSRDRRDIDSTITIGTVMLHTVCSASTNRVHGAPMPRNPMWPGSRSRRSA
ncbi:hypothetical protein AB0E63_01725 [Kribbella sp. NPDC026596]|uniref:hypothetical protein n=1 Tax=Kribbella sp. NPDC026596 TaxID=3155122 RepID=UPI0033D75F86